MSRIREAIVLAMGILGLGAFLYCAMMHTKDRDRVVSVKGLSEREVKADFVIWPIVYKEVGNDLAAIHDAVQVKNAAIEKFLRENGVEERSWKNRGNCSSRVWHLTAAITVIAKYTALTASTISSPK